MCYSPNTALTIHYVNWHVFWQHYLLFPVSRDLLFFSLATHIFSMYVITMLKVIQIFQKYLNCYVVPLEGGALHCELQRPLVMP